LLCSVEEAINKIEVITFPLPQPLEKLLTDHQILISAVLELEFAEGLAWEHITPMGACFEL
jgi:hypothetical protein